MKIAIIGPGALPIPPPEWGGVEIMIWNQATGLRAHDVDPVIVNAKPDALEEEFKKLAANGQTFDWVINHNDRANKILRDLTRFHRGRVVSCCHAPITHFSQADMLKYARSKKRWLFVSAPSKDRIWRALKRTLAADYHFSLSQHLVPYLKNALPEGHVAVIPNPTSMDLMELRPRGTKGAICLGKISARKRQAQVMEALRGKVDLNIIGPDSDFPEERINAQPEYLGPWTRAQVNAGLSDYQAMILWSESEAHPGVIIEGLAAGLSVVVSPQSAEHLDPSLPFVFVVDRKEDLAEATRQAISTNAQHRAEIRKYAEDNFSPEVHGRRVLEALRSWA